MSSAYGVANWIMGGCKKYMSSLPTATSKPTIKRDSVSASSGREGHRVQWQMSWNAPCGSKPTRAPR
eukprot:5741734-Prorocentrum_lima.AAC.1